AKTLSGGSLHNAGHITWIGANLTGGKGATINNLASGVFEAQDNAAMSHNAIGAVPTFNNAGVFRKSTGVGTSIVQWNFNNSGTVESAAGTLMFAAGYQQSAGRILLSGGTFNAS